MKETTTVLVRMIRRAAADVLDFISIMFAIPSQVTGYISNILGYAADIVGGEQKTVRGGKFEK